MFSNYIKVAFRNLKKNRSYAAINIIGLALGLMVSIIVFLYVGKETSYEKHITGHDRIYRIGMEGNMLGSAFNSPASCSPMAEALRTEFTTVEDATRFKTINQEILMRMGEKKFYVRKGSSADSSFFNVFDYEFIHGDKEEALKKDKSIVLTQETAHLLYGDENPINQPLIFDERRNFVVTGVVAPPKGNSHIDFSFFVSSNEIDNIWINNNHYTYVKLNEGVDHVDFNKTIQASFLEKQRIDVEKTFSMSLEEFMAKNEYNFILKPLTDIHLYPQKNWEINANGSIIYVYAFVSIAFLVLLIAGINFMNLATARSSKRAKEVGVRKVSGASRGMLIAQFLIEAVVQCLIALFIAFILVELFLPSFNAIMETDLKLFEKGFETTVFFALAVTLIYGIFAGSYPAFFLSSFRPASVLKGDMTKTKSGSFFRKSMVVLQFAASTILIIGMAIIFSQISFMHNKNLGFSGDQVLVLPMQTQKAVDNFRTHKSEFSKIPNVINISRSSYLPGQMPNQNMYKLHGSEEHLPLWNLEVDYDFFETLDLEIVEGRKFGHGIDNDSTRTFILNETALKLYNLESPIGQRMTWLGARQEGAIVGVVKDFHIEGFSNEIRPMVLSLDNRLWWASIKIAPQNMQATIENIEAAWNKMEPAHPFRYTFLDANFAALFKEQENFGHMFLYLTILAMLIAMMGLYGLAAYSAEQRTKEIGIRKVLGATVPELMKMLTTDFLKLVLIANVLAYPISLLLARSWLSNFSYQIEMPWLPFVFATIVAIVIALLTVSYQAYRAAVANPIEALKYE